MAWGQVKCLENQPHPRQNQREGKLDLEKVFSLQKKRLLVCNIINIDANNNKRISIYFFNSVLVLLK